MSGEKKPAEKIHSAASWGATGIPEWQPPEEEEFPPEETGPPPDTLARVQYWLAALSLGLFACAWLLEKALSLKSVHTPMLKLVGTALWWVPMCSFGLLGLLRLIDYFAPQGQAAALHIPWAHRIIALLFGNFTGVTVCLAVAQQFPRHVSLPLAAPGGLASLYIVYLPLAMALTALPALLALKLLSDRGFPPLPAALATGTAVAALALLLASLLVSLLVEMIPHLLALMLMPLAFVAGAASGGVGWFYLKLALPRSAPAIPAAS